MKTLAIVIVLMFMAGCATIDINEKEGKFKYSRFGNQELIDVSIKVDKEADGAMKMKATLGAQKSEREIAEVLIQAIEMLDRYGKILQSLEGKIPGFF